MKPSNIFPTSVAVASGVITLILFFVRDFEIAGFNLAEGLPLLLSWATTLAAITLLIGIVNLLSVHIRKVSMFSNGWAYSGLLVIAFIGVIFMWGSGALLRFAVEQAWLQGNQTTTNVVNFGLGARDFAFAYIQMPVEASLAAILAIILVLGGARLIRKQRHWTAVLFIGVTLFLIVSLVPISFLPFLADLHEFFMQSLALGATRGILFGVALGVIATGLRVIVGVDHPYGD